MHSLNLHEKLRHVPTIGSDGVISSYFDALKFYRLGHEMIHEGYTKVCISPMSRRKEISS